MIRMELLTEQKQIDILRNKCDNVKNRLSRNKSKENIKNKSSLKINSISKTFKTSKSLYEIRNFEQKIINEILY